MVEVAMGAAMPVVVMVVMVVVVMVVVFVLRAGILITIGIPIAMQGSMPVNLCLVFFCNSVYHLCKRFKLGGGCGRRSPAWQENEVVILVRTNRG
jgi:hypothetical protein